jgi:O-Antigen ligase
MTAVDHPSEAPVAAVGGRLIAAAAFSLPPLMLLLVGLGLAFRGGGVAAQQWQPVAVGLAASLLVLSAVGAVPRVPRAALPTLAALGGLLAWSVLSFAWTGSREQTFEQVIRLSMLAAAMLVGIAYVARPRAALALAVALALCGAIAAGAIEVELLRGTTSVFSGARLSWPIDYANAAAAFVWLPLPALLAFAAAAPPRPLVRGTIGAFAALGLAVGLTTQSRGGAIALAGALVASVAIARDRGRYALTLLVIAGPVAAIASRLVGGDALSESMVRDRGYAALLAAGAAGVLVCGLAMLDRRSRFPFGGHERHAAIAAWALVLALGIGAFVSANGRPDTWISARWNEFTHVESAPAQQTDVTHFGTGTSNRYDYWRVAWHAFEHHPLQGVGAGAFSVPWFRSRSIDENVTDAHSWQASALAETGLVGLVLLGLVLLLPLAGIRTARSSSGAWPIAAVALGGTGVYFVLHASTDWLFRIPAIAIPGFVVLGALATGGSEGDLKLCGRPQQAALAAAALLVVAITVPAYLSTVSVASAETESATAPGTALEDLHRAARLNPFAAEPLVVRSTVLQLEGKRRAALAAAQTGMHRGPNDWTTWIVLGRARRATGDLVGSRSAFRRAATLNPRVTGSEPAAR